MDGVLTKHPSSWRYIHSKFGVDNSLIYGKYSTGAIDYAEFLAGDVLLWMSKQQEIPKSQIVSYLDEIPLMDNLHEGLDRLRESGIKTAIVSGGISWLADKISRVTPFDYIYSNEILTNAKGNIIPEGKIGVIPNEKDRPISEIQKDSHIGIEATASIGDSDFDATMYKRSGLKISFNSASRELIELSDVTISSGDFLDVVRIFL